MDGLFYGKEAFTVQIIALTEGKSASWREDTRWIVVCGSGGSINLYLYYLFISKLLFAFRSHILLVRITRRIKGAGSEGKQGAVTSWFIDFFNSVPPSAEVVGKEFK